MKLELINIIHTLIIWQSVLFAVILATPKYNKKRENKFLALLLLTLGIHFSYNILLTNQLFLNILPQYSCSYGFLYGPFLFLYVQFHFRKGLKFNRLHFLHFMPFIAVIFSTLMGFRICSIAMYLILPVMLIYCLLSFWEILHYKKVNLQISSNFNATETKWIQLLLIVQLIILFLNFLHFQISELTFLGFSFTIESIVQFGLLILVNIMIYQGLKNPHYFQKISKSDLEIYEINKTNEKIDIEALKPISIELKKYMKAYKPFLNPELNLNLLAENLAIHPKTLSQTINKVIGSNFSEYINSYRIEEAKLLFKKATDKNLTIMEVMYEVGFNSRSVFNTAFKNKTGKTPSQFKANK